MILKTKNYTINTDDISFFEHNIFKSHADLVIYFKNGAKIHLNSTFEGYVDYSMEEIVNIINQLNNIK
jgi:hypothetical protein